MKTQVEISAMKIGVNHALMESLKTREWGIRLCFTNEENDCRFEMVLNPDQAAKLRQDILNCEEEITQFKNNIYRSHPLDIKGGIKRNTNPLSPSYPDIH